jgi:hypothetical protein
LTTFQRLTPEVNDLQSELSAIDAFYLTSNWIKLPGKHCAAMEGAGGGVAGVMDVTWVYQPN